jgi:glutaminyl-tRNA synthetase
VKGTLHWVTQKESLDVKINSYDRLFREEAPGANDQSDFLMDINPDSLKIIHAKAEPSLNTACCGDTFQFQRKGYFTVDKNSKANEIVFNKTVGLRDSWKKK